MLTSFARGVVRIVRVARFLPPVILILIAWAVIVLLTGGVDLRSGDLLPGLSAAWQRTLRHVRITSRDPLRPAIAAALLAIVYAIACWPRVASLIEALRRPVERAAPLLAVALGVATLVAGMRHGSFVAGGSDSYGYVSQSRLWLAGEPIVTQPVARQVPWPNAAWTLAPLGYRPVSDEAPASGEAIVPTYAAGLPLLMALGTLVLTPFGRASCGPFVVSPVLGALMVWLMYRLGARLLSRTAGLAAALLLATSPIFIACLLVPMSDLPVAAFVLAATVLAISETRARAAWTGVAASIGVLVRPNLAPLLVVFAAFLAWRAGGWRARMLALVTFGAGALPAIALLAWIHTHLYGAPWRSGYGDLAWYFAWRHGRVNALRYARWLLETQTPFLLAGMVPFLAWRRLAIDRRAPVMLVAAVSLVIWLSYLWYLPFENWETLRFLLGALPSLLILALIGAHMLLLGPGSAAPPALRMMRTVPPALREILLLGLVLLVVDSQLEFAVRDAGLFRRWQDDARLATVARFVDRALPRNAVVLSLIHSGSVRHYAGRLTLRYDLLDPQWWTRALEALVALGYRPYVVLAEWEEPHFRQHIGRSPGAHLAVLPPAGSVYDPLAPERNEPPRSIPPEIECPCTRPIPLRTLP